MSRGLRLLVATAAVATVAAAPCPPMAVTLKTNARAASTYPGKAVQLQARITNLGSAALTNVGVGFYLPNGVCTIRSALAPKSKTGVVPVVEGNNIYWEGLSLPAKKSIQIKLRGQISVGLTSGAALTVGAVGYLVGTNCTATAIPSKVRRVARALAQSEPAKRKQTRTNLPQCFDPANFHTIVPGGPSGAPQGQEGQQPGQGRRVQPQPGGERDRALLALRLQPAVRSGPAGVDQSAPLGRAPEPVSGRVWPSPATREPALAGHVLPGVLRLVRPQQHAILREPLHVRGGQQRLLLVGGWMDGWVGRWRLYFVPLVVPSLVVPYDHASDPAARSAPSCPTAVSRSTRSTPSRPSSAP